MIDSEGISRVKQVVITNGNRFKDKMVFAH